MWRVCIIKYYARKHFEPKLALKYKKKFDRWVLLAELFALHKYYNALACA